METETERIMSELRSIKDDLKYLKKHIPDNEVFLDAEEKKLLEQSYLNEKKNRLLSGNELKKNLRL